MRKEGDVLEMLTFGNLRNKGSVPDRNKDKGQDTETELKEKGKARKHRSEVRRRRTEDGTLNPQRLRTTEIRRAEITVLQY